MSWVVVKGLLTHPFRLGIAVNPSNNILILTATPTAGRPINSAH